MSENKKHGILETKQAMQAIYLVGLFVVERAKDGVDLNDAMALAAKFMDPSFRDVVINGVQGADMIDDEIKDLTFPEFIELAQVVGDLLAMHKKAA